MCDNDTDCLNQHCTAAPLTLEMLRASDKIAITRKEAAEALGVDPRTITAAINSGDIPSVKLGSRKVIPRAKFVRLFE